MSDNENENKLSPDSSESIVKLNSRNLDSWKDLLSDDLITSYDSDLTTQLYSKAIENQIASSINTIPIHNWSSQTLTTSATPSYSVNMNTLQDTYFNWSTIRPKIFIEKNEIDIDVRLDDGSIATLSRADLIKYISEQQLVRENELVRAVYDRYQVALKLVRSDDDGDEGN